MRNAIIGKTVGFYFEFNKKLFPASKTKLKSKEREMCTNFCVDKHIYRIIEFSII